MSSDEEAIKALYRRTFHCDPNAFALANRFLNLYGYEAKVVHVSDIPGQIKWIEFVIKKPGPNGVRH